MAVKTCHDTQAKKPAAILKLETRKQSEARAGRQGGKAKAEAKKQTTTTRNTTRKDSGRKREKETGGKNKRSETTRRDGKEGQKKQKEGATRQKTKESPPGEGPQTLGKPAYTPHRQTTRIPHPKRRHPREGPNETRCASIRSPQPRGVRRARPDSNQTIKSCQDMCPKRTSAPPKD